MKKTVSLLLCLVFTLLPFKAAANETEKVYPYDVSMPAFWFEPAAAEYVPQSDAKALLLAEFSTGRVLFAENELEKLPIASVTKVVSTLLFVEAIDSGRISLDDVVTASENAASTGGSQIYLEAGEEMTVRDLLKSVVVVSANDATVALGEFLCGSEAGFVAEMNRKAEELGCKNSNFVNTNGLPAEDHYSCAYDVALFTRELMKHDMIFEYSGIWMDTIRNGSFGLANTNKLIRYYNGATGMKTGFTNEAGFCLSGTAERDGMKLIAVVLGCSTSDKRFSAAKSLLDYGFANYCVSTPETPPIPDAKLLRGEVRSVSLGTDPVTVLSDKADRSEITASIELPDKLEAPLKAGDAVGKVVYTRGGETVAEAEITVKTDVAEITYGGFLKKLLGALFGV